MNTPSELSAIGRYLPGVIDLFICSSSFEERCLVVPKALRGQKIKKAIVCTNRDQRSIVFEHARTLSNLYKAVNVVEYDTNNALSIADGLLRALRADSKGVRNVVVDTTTFTHEALLILYRILDDSFRKESVKLFFLYNPASSYCYNAESAEDVWLTKGLKDYRTVLGYPGAFHLSRLQCLIVMVGYEYERSKLLIDLLEPDLLVLGHGKEDESVNLAIQKVNEHKYNRLKIMYKDVREFKFSCIDPTQTAMDIQSVLDGMGKYNITVAPMNNKLSTLGLGLLCQELADLRVISSRPNLYNDQCYSKPSAHCYVFQSTQLHSLIV